jgi:DNA-binding response OmpR family regulator
VTTPRETILIVEDDPAILSGLELNLRGEGYHVLVAAECATALRLARERAPDLILLDLMLPDGSGLDVLKTLRREEREMQVVILTARGLENDRVRGLRLGADDYITKPFSLSELLARVEAALRRPRVLVQTGRAATVSFGDVTIDRVRREVHKGRGVVRVTPREFQLLLFLAEHPDRVYTREQLVRAVWGDDYEGTARTVDNFVSTLRGKLEDDPSQPRYLRTVRGAGYCLMTVP